MSTFRSMRVFLLCAALAGAFGGGAAVASPDAMEYVGYSPCTQPVKNILPVTCSAEHGLVHWRLQLHRSPTTHAPATYELWVEYGETANNVNGIARDLRTLKRQGKWTMEGTGARATVKLDGLLSFTHFGPDFIHPLNADGSLMTGNGGWSFTLTNANRLEKPVDPADRASVNSAPSISYQISPLSTGPTVFGVFEGRTPCQGIARELKAQVHPGCWKMKWRITLFHEQGSAKPTTYKMEGSLFRNRLREGKWSYGSGPLGVTYKLEDPEGDRPVQLLRGNDNVLLFLGQDGAPLPGSADFSYTLDRRSDAPVN